MYVDLYPVYKAIGYNISLATSPDLSEVPIGTTVAFPGDLYWIVVMKLREYHGMTERFMKIEDLDLGVKIRRRKIEDSYAYIINEEVVVFPKVIRTYLDSYVEEIDGGYKIYFKDSRIGVKIEIDGEQYVRIPVLDESILPKKFSVFVRNKPRYDIIMTKHHYIRLVPKKLTSIEEFRKRGLLSLYKQRYAVRCRLAHLDI